MTHPHARWRTLFARLPLPLLALAASYGVFEFNRLFVPLWVALISAAAFEATYLGLAVSQFATHERRRAAIIAASAVAVSVIYNSLAALFHRRPELLTAPPVWADVVLALLHGAPLAIVAYNVSVLLLHQDSTDWRGLAATAREEAASLRADLADAHAEAATAREEAATAREEAASLRADLAEAQRYGAEWCEQAATAREEAATATRVESELREDLARMARALDIDRAEMEQLRAESATWHEQAANPPSRTAQQAWALARVAEGLPLAAVARELETPEATVRGWVAAGRTVSAAD